MKMVPFMNLDCYFFFSLFLSNASYFLLDLQMQFHKMI